MGLCWLTADDPPDAFPAIERALVEPDGLLAAGGDLSEARLLYAYRHGIFPWFDDGQPILWWSPDPRCVLTPAGLHVSRRLKRALRRARFQITFNQAFAQVVARCAAPRPGQQETWITGQMASAYAGLHARGWGHSVEVWRDGGLVGGLYGIAIGRVFFGESMFSDVDDASKAAMLGLCRQLRAHDFALLDCQIVSRHLLTMGATTIPRADFRAQLELACEPVSQFCNWPEAAESVAIML